jgi:tetratricopeptide (TPR) repeat protein
MGEAQGLPESGDVAGLLRYLRADGDGLPLGAVAALVAGAGRLPGFDDLAQAAAAVADGGDGPGVPDAVALFLFGYACMERGAGYLAIRPLARALELAPDSGAVLTELVTALEQEGRHARAVALIEDHEHLVKLGWQHRFLYVYNALMAGRLDKAAEGFGRLPEPEDTAWARPGRRCGASWPGPAPRAP